MLRFQLTRSPAGHITHAVAIDETVPWTRDQNFENRNDWKTFEEAVRVAMALNAAEAAKVPAERTVYIPTDAGAHVSPRYDVEALPKVGDDVSYGFNGDSYPCGKITSISKGPDYRRIVAKNDAGTECVFWRLRKTGSWKYQQTWSLMKGVHNERNPSF